MKAPEKTPQETFDRYIETNVPFGVIKKDQTDEVFLLSGEVLELDFLDQIPRKAHRSRGKFSYDTMSIIPYAQARERGMEVQEDAAKIMCMRIREQIRLSLQEALAILPQERLECEQELKPEQSDEEYAEAVRRVIQGHIHKGNACNVVISTKMSGKIAEMSPRKALTIFRNLLLQEFGAYMTFFFFDGKQYHIGASPERHITVNNNEVTMNPISGTYRKVNFLIDRDALKEFLRNPKEINELFMCVDEEVKQMAQMCDEGGTIVGPLLKEMSGLVHTEYLLIGKSKEDCINLLRKSMHAPTVTGSPAESAFRIIEETEEEPRGYYASELVLIGHHADGTAFLDSAITIRTMRITPNGLVVIRVGASIVRDSDPMTEAKEVTAKAGGAARALKNPLSPPRNPQLPSIMDEELRAILQERNASLNSFLMEDQEGIDRTVPELQGKKITIIDFEDQFSFVMKHMIAAMAQTYQYNDLMYLMYKTMRPISSSSAQGRATLVMCHKKK